MVRMLPMMPDATERCRAGTCPSVATVLGAPKVPMPVPSRIWDITIHASGLPSMATPRIPRPHSSMPSADMRSAPKRSASLPPLGEASTCAKLCTIMHSPA